MRNECVAEWMSKMTSQESCVDYLAQVSSGSCSVAELSAACDQLEKRFTVADARSLCDKISDAHDAFWPLWWQGRPLS